MRFRTAAFVTAAALSLASLPAAAQGFGPPGHGPGHGDENPILHMAQELGLNDSQITQVKAITEKYMQGSLGEAMRSEQAARMTVQKTIHDLNATDDQVRQAAAVAAGISSQIAVQHHQMAVEIGALLTSDQKTKLTEMFANMAERHHGPPQGGPGGPGGN
jgi:Spy/CpxP family protein refolding chaperone